MRYRVFGRSGLRVSSMILGTGNFGTGWGYGAEEPEARRIYESYRAAGGNFVDTADQYHYGQSETMLANFIAGDRDEIVLASKFSLEVGQRLGVLRSGNSRRAMIAAVEQSLRRIRTDRLDVLWVHYPDDLTPIDEIMRGLDDLARSGKIIYVGFSNFPAWRVATAATLAELRGWASVAGVQTEYSLVERTAEREIIPMARAFGISVAAWSPLGGGLLTGKYRRGETGRKQGLGSVIHDEDAASKTDTLNEILAIARDTGLSPIQISLSWLLRKDILPIMGPRTAEQLAANLAAYDASLNDEHISRLDAVSAPVLGSPHDGNMTPRLRAMLTGVDLASIEPITRPVR